MFDCLTRDETEGDDCQHTRDLVNMGLNCGQIGGIHPSVLILAFFFFAPVLLWRKSRGVVGCIQLRRTQDVGRVIRPNLPQHLASGRQYMGTFTYLHFFGLQVFKANLRKILFSKTCYQRLM